MPISFLDLDEDEEEEFLLYGVVSPNMMDYKFIYHVNLLLSTSFVFQPDLDVYFRGQLAHFGNYYYFDFDSKNDCYFINNISRTTESLMPENSLFQSMEERFYLLERYKRYNFLLKLSGNITKEPSFALSLQKLNFIYETQLLNLTKTEKNLLLI